MFYNKANKTEVCKLHHSRRNCLVTDSIVYSKLAVFYNDRGQIYKMHIINIIVKCIIET